MKNSLASLYEKEATKKVLSSLISILIGLLVGAVVVTIVGLTKKTIGLAGLWDGIRIVFVGIFCKGRDAAGALEWGFNGRTVGNMLFRATPIIMTGLSVAVSYKTGLFNMAGIAESDLGSKVYTGYGREFLGDDGAAVTEITCHARGAHLGSGVCGRHSGRRSVGRNPRNPEGLPQHQ